MQNPDPWKNSRSDSKRKWQPKMAILLLIIVIVSLQCARLTEQEESKRVEMAESSCITCHTNSEVLKALAVADYTGGHSDGG